MKSAATPSVSPTSSLGPTELHALARAFAHVEDFDRFVAALGAALPASADGMGLGLRLDGQGQPDGERFATGVLNLPLPGAGGLLQARPASRRKFGAEDLHLLAGLADFLSVALGLALRTRDAGRARSLLRLLLNQAPTGIAAYGPDRRIITANDLAARWLADATPPFEELQAGATHFHLRAEGRLIRGEARRLAEADGGAWVLVLHDLAPEQGRFMDGLAREVFRGLAEGAPRTVALLESPGDRHGALGRLGELRAVLAPGELAGPYDATRAALVLPLGGLAARARLRALRPVLAAEVGARAGCAELGRDGRSPEALIAAALANAQALDPMLRPAVLLHGEHPAAADALDLVLGREFVVVRSESAERTRALLAARAFEGIFVGSDEGRPGADGAEVARLARAAQPGICVFQTTVGPAAEARAEPGAIIVEKPFDVAGLIALVRGRLSAPPAS